MTIGTTSRRGVIWWIGASLFAVHAVVAAINLSPLIDSYTVASVFDMNAENTAPTWLSSTLLLVIAGLFGFGAWAEYQQERPRSVVVSWMVIAAGFVVLSLDETASLHELAGEKAASIFEIEALPSLYTWVIVVAPLAAVAAVWLIRWFGRTFGWRTDAGRLAVLAVGLWMTVPLFEALDPSLGGPRLLVVAEETFEMVGVTLAIIALLIHFRSRGYRVRLDAG